jgi:3-phenylpropionate/trans-cinnamate dioxygenase beta subunit
MHSDTEVVAQQQIESVDAETERAIRNFVYFEAELLDDWRFRDWLALLDEAMEYTMPTQANALTRDRLKSVSPPTSFYFCDNKAQLEQRIRRLETGMGWAEEPPSRTRHLITNIRVSAIAGTDRYQVKSNFLLYRQRMAMDIDIYAGERTDVLSRSDQGAGWIICRRDLILDQATLASNNLSILF